MSTTTIIDIGVNLGSKQFANYHATYLDHTYQAYVESIISISNCRKEWDVNLGLIDNYKENPIKIYTTIGIHPHSAKEVKDIMYTEMLDYLSKPNVVAVGECGLDYNRLYSTAEVQKQVFLKQIEIAAKIKKPLYLHERDASEDMIEILTKAKATYPELKGVIHCFTGNKETINAYLKLGFYIGITGWICDNRRNGDLIEAIKCLPLDKLMIETDSPWLVPHEYMEKYNTKRNESDSLSYVIDAISFHTKYSVEEIRKSSKENTIKLFF